jgi:hypothetical protein
MAVSALCLPSSLAFLDELPELTRLAELRVFRNWQFAAEKKIAKRVLV